MSNQALIFGQTIITPADFKNVRRRRRGASFSRLDPYDGRAMHPPISYAPSIPWYRGSRLQGRLVRFVIAGAVLCALLWTFRFFQQVQFLILEQGHAMHYTMPADRIVLAAGTPDAPRLLSTSGYHTLGSVFDRTNKSPVAAHNPPKDVPLFWSPNETYVFLHARRSEHGSERLLSVVIAPQRPFEPGRGYDLTALAQAPANLTIGSRPTACSDYGTSGTLNIRLNDSLRIYAGQLDPTDESHFTIRYDLDQKSNVIDGWLMPDDSVRLEPRS